MLNHLLLYLGALLTFIWGAAHLVPTRSVVRAFGEISADNKRIITMEWIIEGVTLIFIAILVSGTTYLGHATTLGYFNLLSAVILLFTLAVISLFTGFRVNFLPYRLCPVIFSISALCIIAGIYL